MAYDIELMSIGEDLYSVLDESATLLNSVQQEFRFRLTSVPQRPFGISFSRAEYSTADIWSFLREQRKKFGGNRPYIIAFVNAPLKSSELANIFGSHEAGEGLAVVTLHNSKQYVREARRYCCYYLARYSLSFANPSIRSHTDEERKKCYFHRKMRKPDIRASMDSGYVCDADQSQLDNPQPGVGAKPLSNEERDALRKMRDVVSGDYPHALVMKGGGVKGLAFAAALLELEKHFWFDRHVGASAGAIAAVLLASGYSPSELVDLLRQKNFRDFMDAPLWRIPFNLLMSGGCYPGEHFRRWITEMLRSKITKESEIAMSDLHGAIIYASRRGPGTVTFDSEGERKETVAAFATRCSMSIPLFFVPQQIEGRRVYDGGLRNNFPVSRFLDDHPGTHFVALYLSSANDKEKAWMGCELLEIWIDGEERQIVDKHAASVVVIDTRPVGTVHFNLRPIEKEFLLKVGKASALKFLQARNLDDGPAAEAVKNAQDEAEKCRNLVVQMRKWRRIRRASVVVVLLASLYGVGPTLARYSRVAWHKLWPSRPAPIQTRILSPAPSEVARPVAGAYQPRVSIRLAALVPKRYLDTEEQQIGTNYDGPSCAAFVTLANGAGIRNASDFAVAVKDQLITSSWETSATEGGAVAVDLVHDGDPTDKTYIVQEIGLDVRKVEEIGPGTVVWFLKSTGASGPIAEGVVRLTQKPALYPVASWGMEEGGRPAHKPGRKTYLRPGEPMFWRIELEYSPRATAHALGLTVGAYVKITVGGQDFTITSKDTVRFAAFGPNTRFVRVDPQDLIREVERLRRSAYSDAPAMPAKGIEQDVDLDGNPIQKNSNPRPTPQALNRE